MGQAKAAKPKAKELHVSGSGRKIAEALVKHFPKDAEGIVKTMLSAATNKSMRRKLTRIQMALKGGAA